MLPFRYLTFVDAVLILWYCIRDGLGLNLWRSQWNGDKSDIKTILAIPPIIGAGSY